MASADWKEILKNFIEASYERVLRDIPDSFEGCTRQEKKTYRRKLKIVRRRAIFDISFGVAVLVGNGLAATRVSFATGTGLQTSAAAGVILFRRGGHALIESSSRLD